ncbi:MAG: mycofactocin biosynthesis glycosyltransferase MftF [Thermoleophilia bacterium]
MIPLSYRLREGVRVETSGAGWTAVCELPLAVIRVNAAAAKLLELTRGGRRVADLAAALSTDEERILRVCEYYRARGMLDVDLAVAAEAGGPPAGGPSAGGPPGAGGAAAPSISVIVPTKDRAAELEDCLVALFAVDYPRERLEVVVVDDGSRDDTAEVARRHPCTYLANDRNRGQSYSRNVGARAASGEILAFIDSDCVASPEWLRELVPFFSWPALAAVGGLVTGYYDESRLDRYEQVASSLNMGDRLILMADDRSMSYVPTCNLLVRREAYLELGGLREELRVGEDVDFCWRLRAAGWRLVYSPTGAVGHKHRNRLSQMLRRRAAYGTSEALLHALHPGKRKTMRVRLLPAVTVGIVAAAAVRLEPRFLLLGPLPLVGDGLRGTVHLARSGVRVRPRRVWFAAFRGHASFAYSVSYHLVRYYLVPCVAVAFVAPGVGLAAAAALAYVTAVDYRVKRPQLSFPVFLGFSLAEHTAYQVGVVVGCVRRRSFRSYLITFSFRRAPSGS